MTEHDFGSAPKAGILDAAAAARIQQLEETVKGLTRAVTAESLQEKVLADMFQVSVSTVSRVVIMWANYRYLLLVENTMPSKFVQYSRDVRVIIDCTEVRCQNPSSLTLQSEVFLILQEHDNLKGLDWDCPL